ncbi:hypothetical protein Tco_1377684 [Tanacetum coccineum]
MKEQAYNMINTKDSRTQRQSNLNKSKESRFKILPQQFEYHTLDTTTESLDEQLQQHKVQDATLVLIKDQAQIPMNNLMIALEKIQPDVIFNVCLEILKQQSFYKAFISSADVLEIYM